MSVDHGKKGGAGGAKRRKEEKNKIRGIGGASLHQHAAVRQMYLAILTNTFNTFDKYISGKGRSEGV